MGSGATLSGTLTEAFTRAPRADRGVRFIDARGREGERIPYAELVPRWRDRAARMATLGASPGRLVFVCLPPSWDWYDAWVGALLAGAVPVCIAPPGGIGTSKHQLDRLESLVGRFGPVMVVCSEKTRALALARGDALAGVLRTPEEIAGTPPAVPAPDPRPQPEDPAFLQLTSGSTGFPRAVTISHRALLATVETIRRAAPRSDPEDRFTIVSWLPVHHDMGLVGAVLFTAVLGYDLCLVSQRAFLGRPHVWLRALGGAPFGAAAAPNFAYRACTERVTDEQLAGADLSNWGLALTGSEMIRPEVMEAFVDRFSQHGLRAESMIASYGMAETTLIVTMDQRREGIRSRAVPGLSAPVCSVGAIVDDMEMRICAPDGTELPDGEIGEVRTRGACLFSGYHDDAEATAEAVVDGWLRTGDLGFIESDELYITGRLKELLIVNGNNVMPHELERVADAITGGGGRSRSGAFSVDVPGVGEEPVLVAEENGEARYGELSAAIRAQVGHATGLTLRDVVFVRRGSIPKTSSGKVQRTELRRLYLARELERLEP